MNRRKLAISIIVAEVAETGKAGKCAIRAYCETRMSRRTFDDACAIGLKIWDRKQSNAAGAVGGYMTRAQSPQAAR